MIQHTSGRVLVQRSRPTPVLVSLHRARTAELNHGRAATSIEHRNRVLDSIDAIEIVLLDRAADGDQRALDYMSQVY